EIYLSWPGTIQRYDLRSRQVAATWTFDAAGPATLAGLIGSEPLSVAGGVARAGTREIARGVHGMFTSGANVWLTREEAGQRYLETHPLASLVPQSPTRPATPSCLFLTPGAGDAVALHDARRLSNGLVAVKTDGGVRLHNRDRHSWYAVAGLLPDTGRGTLATIGSTLILSDGSDARVTVQIVRSAITLPDSCSPAPARVDRAPEFASARAVAIDERAAKAYVMKNDGSVDGVDEAATVAMIAGEGQGPPEADIVRAWHFPDVAASVLWVSTRRSLWQYDLEHHRWFEIALEYPALRLRSGQATSQRAEEVSIDLDSGSGEIAVLVAAASETFRGTAAKQPGRQSKIGLVRSTGPTPAEGDRRAESPVFRVGAVTFFRNVSHGLLAILRSEDGRSTPAYQNRAFVWDRGRRGIAIGREGPLLLTEAGVHAAGSPASYSSFDPGPPGKPSPADRLTSGPDLAPPMLRGKRWVRRITARRCRTETR